MDPHANKKSILELFLWKVCMNDMRLEENPIMVETMDCRVEGCETWVAPIWQY